MLYSFVTNLSVFIAHRLDQVDGSEGCVVSEGVGVVFEGEVRVGDAECEVG